MPRLLQSVYERGDVLGRRHTYSGVLARRRSSVTSARNRARLGRLMAARSLVRRVGYGAGGPRSMEYKSIDDATGVLAVDNASTVRLLNGIQRGDDISNRIGRRITLRSIELRGYNYVTTATGTDQIHRVMLVLDAQPNGAALTTAMVLETVSHLSPRNLENRMRFRILFDKTMALNSDLANHEEPGARKIWKIYKRFHIPVTFNAGDAGTIADITTNSLYLILIGSNAAGVTAGSFQGYSRLRFTDD